MATAFEPISDLVSLRSAGLDRSEGAYRALGQIRSHTRRLDLGGNALGDEGVGTLIDGLSALERQYSYTIDHPHTWGLTEVDLSSNGLTDAAVGLLMNFVAMNASTQKMKLVLGNNRMEWNDVVEYLVYTLNTSEVRWLDMALSDRLRPEAVSLFFATLSSPHLSALCLDRCDLGPALAKPIIEFLISHGSAEIRYLDLNFNCFGLDATRSIVDAVQRDNYTIQYLPISSSYSFYASAGSIGPNNPVTEEEIRDEPLLAQQVFRLEAVTSRNSDLAQRITTATVKSLAFARIVLNAVPSGEKAGDSSTRLLRSPSGTPIPCLHFPLLDFPIEIRHLIIRHSSGDPTAFSEAQFLRLLKAAQDRRTIVSLSSFRAQRREEELGRPDRVDLDGIDREVRATCLRRGRWDRWERDLPHELGDYLTDYR